MNNAEEYKKLKTNLLLLSSGNALKTIMVSSSTVREGASTVASNLAVIMAKDSTLNILLVDTNLRHPTLHKVFKLRNNDGLSEVVVGSVEIQDVLRETELQNLSLITVGNSSANLSDILESSSFEELVVQLKDAYDYVIFDVAPINTCSDGSLLTRQMDGVILVVRSGKTRREVVQKAKEQLERANAKIVGVVLNRRRYVIPKLFYNRL
jgi:capsular exopolysaccharide synthesis family protein